MADNLDLPRTRENLHGPEIRADGSVRFRLWAPARERIKLEISDQTGPLPMLPLPGGWHELVINGAPTGTRYCFVLPDGMRVPDPASRYQPLDVHGPSELVDTANWTWSDSAWAGRPWEEAVIYELHMGAFTPDGSFRAAIGRLDYLVALGITAVEIMPVADFPGRRNWGYDGVLPFAPDSSYGRPEDFKALVEAAHERGLMVLLDVVYNHFGPDGNYLSVYAPKFFSDRRHTPWGPAINFDGPGNGAVREFMIENAIYWIRQFHLDGLRVDAVHAIHDESPKHILRELAERVRGAAPHRRIHLILENDENESSFLERNGSAPRFYTAQWNDDLHHVLHTSATGEDQGYYSEYHGDTDKLGRALAEGFAFQGEMMRYRNGATRGEPSAHLPPSAFISFLQNHDQIGNRAFGERIGLLACAQAIRAVSAAFLLMPQIPMLFMGEEWNSVQPFPFFCDFGSDLAEAVRKGRREEFSKFPEFQDPAQRERIPDPQSVTTFESAKLRWDALEEPGHREWLDWHRRILERRRERILPLLPRIQHGGTFRKVGDAAVFVSWHIQSGGELLLAANLSPEPVSGFPTLGSLIWQEGSAANASGTLQPWTVLWSFGGSL